MRFEYKFAWIFCATLMLAPPTSAAATGRAYYVHADAGSDEYAGSLAKPWKSVERVNRQALRPGDQVYFARGTSYLGPVIIRDSGASGAPLVVGAYGQGPAPRLSNPYFSVSMGRIVEVSGSHVVVENLFLHDTPTPPPDEPPLTWKLSAQHKKVFEMGAVFVHHNASHVTIRGNEFVNAVMGIRVRGSHSLVSHNLLRDAAKITEQWGAIAINIVGPHNEVAYNVVENYGFYGGTYVNDGAVVELDGEDPHFNAHHIRIHHNVSRNVKGGFVEIAGKANDVLIDHNVSDDVDKFLGASNVKGIEVRNNTVIRTRLPAFPKSDFFPLGTVFWSFNDKADDQFTLSNNVFYLDRLQRLYKSTEHPLGIVPTTRERNLYFSPNADAAGMLGMPLAAGELVGDPRFVNAAKGDYRVRHKAGPGWYYGAYAPGRPLWQAGPRALTATKR
ncbi:MAG: right-handed parallel beta-helix repeat-containing protein [Pseudomonadota bacterium]